MQAGNGSAQGGRPPGGVRGGDIDPGEAPPGQGYVVANAGTMLDVMAELTRSYLEARQIVNVARAHSHADKDVNKEELEEKVEEENGKKGGRRRKGMTWAEKQRAKEEGLVHIC